MLRAFVKGGAALERNANCTYTVNDILTSNCSNGLLYIDEIRGKCIEGECVCNEGYTGASDWINLDGLDCQRRLISTSVTACFTLGGCLWVYTVCFRLLWKICKRSKEKDIRQILKKTPTQVALSIMVTHLLVAVLCIVKLVSLTTPMVDPKRNPVFFSLIFLSLNAEWFAYSISFRTIVDPFVNGLNKQSDRKALTAVSRVLDIAKRVPMTDIILRVCLVIAPALVSAATDNDTLTIRVYFFSRIYSLAKYLAFGVAFAMCMRTVTNIESVSRSSSSTNRSTNTSLEAFRTKIKFVANVMLFILCPLCALTIMNLLALPFFKVYYGIFDFAFIYIRGLFAYLHSLSLEILYLDAFPLLLERVKRWRTKGPQESSLNIVIGSFGIKARNEGGNSFGSENPMRESKIKVPNPML